jgi:hypothetical protein
VVAIVDELAPPMLQDATNGTVMLKAVDPLDPIEWNAPLVSNRLAFNRRSRRGFTRRRCGSLTVARQFPEPSPARTKSVSDRLYAECALGLSELLRIGDVLTFSEQSYLSGHHFELRYTHGSICERTL